MHPNATAASIRSEGMCGRGCSRGIRPFPGVAGAPRQGGRMPSREMAVIVKWAPPAEPENLPLRVQLYRQRFGSLSLLSLQDPTSHYRESIHLRTSPSAARRVQWPKRLHRRLMTHRLNSAGFFLLDSASH